MGGDRHYGPEVAMGGGTSADAPLSFLHGFSRTAHIPPPEPLSWQAKNSGYPNQPDRGRFRSVAILQFARPSVRSCTGKNVAVRLGSPLVGSMGRIVRLPTTGAPVECESPAPGCGSRPRKHDGHRRASTGANAVPTCKRREPLPHPTEPPGSRPNVRGRRGLRCGRIPRRSPAICGPTSCRASRCSCAAGTGRRAGR